jgi:hypothetical protein
MAAPNLLNINSIIGKTVGANLTNVFGTVLSNPSSSSNLIRINSVVISNIQGTNNADVSVSILKNNSTDFFLGRTISVPADTTLVLATKDMNLYLEENDTLRANASANNHLHLFASYEVIT